MRLTIEREPSIDPQFLDSSIMALPESAQFVFIWMILLANKDGILDMGPTALARRLCRPVETIKTALKLLETEDPESRSPEAEGARIRRVRANDSAWQIINYDKYTHLTIRCEPEFQSLVMDATGGVLDLGTFNGVLIGDSIIQSATNEGISSPYPSSQHTKESNTGRKAGKAEKAGSEKTLFKERNQQAIPGIDGAGEAHSESIPNECVEWIPINGMIPSVLNRGPVRSVDGRWEYGVTTARVEEWSKVFPGLDVCYQIRLCRQWNMESPGRRKTYPNRGGGVLKHITSWLAKAYEKKAAQPTPQKSVYRAPVVVSPEERYKDKLKELIHSKGLPRDEKAQFFGELNGAATKDELLALKARLDAIPTPGETA